MILFAWFNPRRGRRTFTCGICDSSFFVFFLIQAFYETKHIHNPLQEVQKVFRISRCTMSGSRRGTGGPDPH